MGCEWVQFESDSRTTVGWAALSELAEVGARDTRQIATTRAKSRAHSTAVTPGSSLRKRTRRRVKMRVMGVSSQGPRAAPVRTADVKP